MTYKDLLIREMRELAKDTRTIFIGYNTAYGHRFNGTLNTIPKKRCLEMPVAENLIMGVAMGMSLEGYRPIVCIERMDFLLACADAIINHLDKLPQLSGGQFNFPVVIRTCVGDDVPLDPGIQHKGDYTYVFMHCKNLAVVTLPDTGAITKVYKNAQNTTTPMMIIEYKELYSLGVPR